MSTDISDELIFIKKGKGDSPIDVPLPEDEDIDIEDDDIEDTVELSEEPIEPTEEPSEEPTEEESFISLDRSKTNFPLELSRYTTGVMDDYKKLSNAFLKPYQYLLKRFCTDKILKHPLRGILMMHKMGTGKTISSIAVAIALRRPIIVMCKLSIIEQFKKDIILYCQKFHIKYDEILDSLKFITLGAMNMMKQLDSITYGSLEGYTIIIDEAHNLFRQILSGSINGTEFYTRIMNTSNLKVIILTGTPINKDPAELIPCFNIITGQQLFSEDITDFYTYFIEHMPDIDSEEIEKVAHMINKGKFQNRIMGLISYVEIGLEDFPRQTPTKIIKVPMNLDQYVSYKASRMKESAEKTFKGRKMKFGEKTQSYTSYRLQSRTFSNHLGEISPKAEELVKNVELEKGKGLAYSQFIESGIQVMADEFKKHGWIEVNLDNMDTKTGENYKRFIMLSGEISKDDRTKLLDLYNKDSNNLYGENVRMLLASGAYSEGITLSAAKHVHIFDPYWTYSRIDQVIGRAVRSHKHDNLPLEDRIVNSYVYLSTIPTGITSKEKLTTDEYIYDLSLRRQIIIDEFLIAMKEACIDCPHLGGKFKCRMCAPSNKNLFTSSIADDMARKDPCKELQTAEAEVKSIKLDSKTYKYTTDNDDAKKSLYKVVFYEYKKSYDAYVKIKEDSELFKKLYSKVTIS
jgi:hypothetical protein